MDEYARGTLQLNVFDLLLAKLFDTKFTKIKKIPFIWLTSQMIYIDASPSSRSISSPKGLFGV